MMTLCGWHIAEKLRIWHSFHISNSFVKICRWITDCLFSILLKTVFSFYAIPFNSTLNFLSDYENMQILFIPHLNLLSFLQNYVIYLLKRL